MQLKESDMFNQFISLIQQYIQADNDFALSSKLIEEFINHLSKQELMDILVHIGIIPESIEHDSTAEKLFSKASDSVLSRTFRELGLNATVLTERADSADVVATSTIYGYSLVADAKAFRLSRTAKNQKDFKVEALSRWRGNNQFAILASPYFQYPASTSQIYQQALNQNVCLLSWEYLLFLLQSNIKETHQLNLSHLWNFSAIHANNCSVADSKKCFLMDFNHYFCKLIGSSDSAFNECLQSIISSIEQRGEAEKLFWRNEEKIIRAYSKEQAIDELLKVKKIDSKIKQIDKYVKGLSK